MVVDRKENRPSPKSACLIAEKRDCRFLVCLSGVPTPEAADVPAEGGRSLPIRMDPDHRDTEAAERTGDSERSRRVNELQDDRRGSRVNARGHGATVTSPPTTENAESTSSRWVMTKSRSATCPLRMRYSTMCEDRNASTSLVRHRSIRLAVSAVAGSNPASINCAAIWTQPY